MRDIGANHVNPILAALPTTAGSGKLANYGGTMWYDAPTGWQNTIGVDWDPSWQGGALSCTNDPSFATGTFKGTSGTVYGELTRATKVVTSGGTVVLTLNVTTAGATLTSGQNLLGLYRLNNSSGAWEQVAKSADQSSAWTSTGIKTVSCTTSAAINAADWLYVVMLSVGTTTPTVTASLAAPLINQGISSGGRQRRWSWASQTALPSTLTLSNLVATTQVPFLMSV